MWYVDIRLSPQLPSNLPSKVLVHGEQMAMGRLRAAMTSRYKDRDEDVKIHTPRNLETLNLSFRGERVAKVNILMRRRATEQTHLIPR
jgi:cleavage and polyadenylation specificity factor subunit 3